MRWTVMIMLGVALCGGGCDRPPSKSATVPAPAPTTVAATQPVGVITEYDKLTDTTTLSVRSVLPQGVVVRALAEVKGNSTRGRPAGGRVVFGFDGNIAFAPARQKAEVLTTADGKQNKHEAAHAEDSLTLSLPVAEFTSLVTAQDWGVKIDLTEITFTPETRAALRDLAGRLAP
jgi:hypothetical protein